MSSGCRGQHPESLHRGGSKGVAYHPDLCGISIPCRSTGGSWHDGCGPLFRVKDKWKMARHLHEVAALHLSRDPLPGS